MSTAAQRRLTKIETELRLAIREAICAKELFTDNSAALYSRYTACGGEQYYDELRKQEQALMDATPPERRPLQVKS